MALLRGRLDCCNFFHRDYGNLISLLISFSTWDYGDGAGGRGVDDTWLDACVVHDFPKQGTLTPKITGDNLLLPPANEIWGKVKFSQVFICPQGGGDLGGGLHPWGGVLRLTGESICIWRGLGRPSLGNYKSGWCVTYWNAFLFWQFLEPAWNWCACYAGVHFSSGKIKHSANLSFFSDI